jgi:MFS family permease
MADVTFFESARLRAVGALFTGVVFMNTAMVGASAVATLIAADVLGNGWSGAPNAAGVLGTAIGALGLSALMARRGRRIGLRLAYGLAAAGALLASAAVLVGALPLLFGGMLLLGVGNAGAQLSRYAAAELYPVERRGLVLGAIVWGGTIGAVVGPNLIAPAASAAEALQLPPLVGSYLLALVAAVGAAVAVLAMPRPSAAASEPARSVFALDGLRQPGVRLALGAMVAAHFTMVAVMTMTPLHLQLHGQGLHVVGVVLSAHMLGMFALAPLSGRLADRVGGRTTINLGIGALLAAALLAAYAPVGDDPSLPIALFLLGYGWNLCFVGGSSTLSRELAPAVQAQTQGVVDALVWSTSALASLFAGALLASGGYGLVAAVAGAVALVPVGFILATGARSGSARAATDERAVSM